MEIDMECKVVGDPSRDERCRRIWNLERIDHMRGALLNNSEHLEIKRISQYLTLTARVHSCHYEILLDPTAYVISSMLLELVPDLAEFSAADVSTVLEQAVVEIAGKALTESG